MSGGRPGVRPAGRLAGPAREACLVAGPRRGLRTRFLVNAFDILSRREVDTAADHSGQAESQPPAGRRFQCHFFPAPGRRSWTAVGRSKASAGFASDGSFPVVPWGCGRHGSISDHLLAPGTAEDDLAFVGQAADDLEDFLCSASTSETRTGPWLPDLPEHFGRALGHVRKIFSRLRWLPSNARIKGIGLDFAQDDLDRTIVDVHKVLEDKHLVENLLGEVGSYSRMASMTEVSFAVPMKLRISATVRTPPRAVSMVAEPARMRGHGVVQFAQGGRLDALQGGNPKRPRRF